MSPVLRQRWQQFAARIDALNPRERVLSFAAAVAVVAFVGNAVVLAPLARKQAALQAQGVQQREATSAANDEIAKQLEAFGKDPNVALRARLAAVRADTGRMEDELRTMEKGLVPADRMTPVLESMLRANGRLKLVSLRTLPVDTIDGALDAGTRPALPAPVPAPVPAEPAAPAHGSGVVLYRHGVELTVRGSYLDMVDYMHALEGLPTQLFWGRAQLDAEDDPGVRLTLTLYTLSLDPKWMKL